jgi:prephenate dehydrogenase
MRIERLLIVGVGLIGGSFALALRKKGLVGHVAGVGRDPANLQRAVELGVIDKAYSSIDEHAAKADFVLIATPVRQMGSVLSALAPHLSAGTVVTDAGSTKQDVVAAARAALGPKLSQFVPAHPIAGREKSGVTAAEAQLYEGRNVVLTPLAENAAADVQRVEGAWRACGANVTRMHAAQHDAVFAAVSHLPHMLAYALVDDLASRPNADELLSFAAGGFRDFTRIASSSPEMWRDIALNNRAALLAEIDAYQTRLDRLRKLIDLGDGHGLERLMGNARDVRDAWLEQFDTKTRAASNATSKISPE